MRLFRNLHYDSVVPKGKRSYPLGVPVVPCLILPAEACPRTTESAGCTTLHIDTVREFLPMSIAPGNQANSAGFSWQLLQALQYLRVRRVGHQNTAC